MTLVLHLGHGIFHSRIAVLFSSELLFLGSRGLKLPKRGNLRKKVVYTSTVACVIMLLKKGHSKDKQSRAVGSSVKQGSEMRGFLRVLSPSLTLSPIYDGFDVNVTSTVGYITWFHLNHDMVSRRIHTPFIYGGHSLTVFVVLGVGSYCACHSTTCGVSPIKFPIEESLGNERNLCTKPTSHTQVMIGFRSINGCCYCACHPTTCNMRCNVDHS